MVDYLDAYTLIDALRSSIKSDEGWVQQLLPPDMPQAGSKADAAKWWATIKEASQAVELNRALGELMRNAQEELPNAQQINIRYKAKPNSRDPDDMHDLKRIDDILKAVDRRWENIQLKFAPVLRLVPSETVTGLDKYITNKADRPTPASYLNWINDLYGQLYQLFRTVNSLKQERKMPRRLMQLKPSERYAGNREVYDDFGSLLQDIEQGYIMAQHDEPHASNEVLESLAVMPDRQSVAGGRWSEGEALFVRHHLNRIKAIESDWRKINQGVLQIVKQDSSDMALLADEMNERKLNAPAGGTEENPIEWNTYAGGFVEGYHDLVDIALPLTRDLTNKYMVIIPNTSGRTYKQARQVIVVWYKATLERAVRLYQFLGKYMGFRSSGFVPQVKGLTWLARFKDGQVFVTNEKGIVQPHDIGGRVGDFVAYHLWTPAGEQDYRGVVIGYRNKQLVVKPTAGAPKPLPSELVKSFSDFSVVTPRESLPGQWSGVAARPLNARV